MTTKSRTAQLQGRAVQITVPRLGNESELSMLLVEIEVTCPECGTYTLRLAGHHLRAVRDLLIDFIDQFPTLTGSEGTQTVTDRTVGETWVDPKATIN